MVNFAPYKFINMGVVRNVATGQGHTCYSDDMISFWVQDGPLRWPFKAWMLNCRSYKQSILRNQTCTEVPLFHSLTDNELLGVWP